MSPSTSSGVLTAWFLFRQTQQRTQRFNSYGFYSGLPPWYKRVRTPVLHFFAVGKSLYFQVEATSLCGGCVWFCGIHHVIFSWCCTFSACVQHMFSTRRREGLKVTLCQLKTMYYFVLQRSLSCHLWPCTSTRELTGRQQRTCVTLLWVYKDVCFAFTSPCSVLVFFTNRVYLISNCCFCLASEYHRNHMKQCTYIHSDKKSTFCMTPLKGCNSQGCNSTLNAIIHPWPDSDTSAQAWSRRKSSSPAHIFKNSKFNHL